MINLPDVTLVNIDTFYHDLARMAIEDSCREINFDKVIVFTDKANTFKFDNVADEIVEVEASSKEDAAHVLWYKVSKRVKTSHFLTVQWDGFVICPELWTDNWLKYDYIGAPWWCGRDDLGELGVGNGGFSLRSKRLMDLVARDFPYFIEGIPEDLLLCGRYRRQLEALGFKWADEDTASRFSFDCELYKAFGFHSMSNWPFVLDKGDYENRKSIVKKYINERNEHLFALMEQNANVVERMGSNCYGFVKECENIGHRIPSREAIEGLESSRCFNL